jgi:tetratricopeptide (TPR) repeat protein
MTPIANPDQTSQPARLKHWLKVIWFTIPAILVIFHYTKGRILLAADRATILLQNGHSALAEEKWQEAASAFTAALSTAPESRLDLLAQAASGKAKTLIEEGDLYEAIDLLTPLLNSSETARALPKMRMDEIRATAAQARYYAGYALKLENAPRELWIDELELARQQLRLLSTDEAKSNPAASSSPYLLNLEQVHRVERETVYELQGRKIPSPCQGACKKSVLKKKCDRCKGNKTGEQPDQKNGSGTREKYKLESGS